jgi:LPS export ABC transporter protein LptC
MNKIKGIILFAIFMIVLISSVIITLNWKSRKKEIVRPIQKGVDLSIKSLHYIEIKKGVKLWELVADSADHIKNKKITVFNNFKVSFFTKSGKKHILTGEKGEMKDDTKDMDAKGNIVATLDGGYILKTGSLRYDSKKRVIFGNDMVYIKGPNVKIVGKGILIDINKEKLILLKNVKTEIVR